MAVSKRVRYEVLKRDNHMCRYCGGTAPDVKLTIDHVIPVALGGADTPDNLVAACRDCNAGKTSTSPDAPLVADVANDALRWAAAMAKAAEERREADAEVERKADAWLGGWQSYELHYGRRDQGRLPLAWKNSLIAMVRAGLSWEDLYLLVEPAWSSRADDKFRYFCGCGWNRVRQMQERARELVGGEHDDVSAANLKAVDDKAYDDGYGDGYHDGDLTGGRFAWSHAWAWAQLHGAPEFPVSPEFLTAEETADIEAYLYPPRDDPWTPGTWSQAVEAARSAALEGAT